MEKQIDFQRITTNKIFLSVKENFRKYPCFAVLTAVLAAVLPTVISPRFQTVSMLLPVLLTGIGWFLLGVRKSFFQLALPAFAGLCGLYCNMHFRQNDQLSELLRSRETVGVEAAIQVCDPSLYPSPSQSKSSSRRRAVCRVDSIRFSPSDTWQKVNASVLAVFPPDVSGLRYGSQFRIKGELRRPGKPVLPSAFDYDDYLRRHGISFVLQVKDAEKTGEEHSAYGYLLSVRNSLLAVLSSRLKSPNEQALAAALLFGCRQEISRESRLKFIQSGAIHILTVSGLHIGMFASAVFILLLPVPFQIRMLLTPVLTLLYAFATGMQMPALRAVLMLFCWCIPRAFMLRGNSLNSVMLACSLLLIWNPFQLKDAGFQYSFLCVFFLILTAEQTASWIQLMQERQKWIPDNKQSKLKRLLTRSWTGLIFAAGGCLTAWLCSFILTVYYQGIAVPFAAVANLLILTAVYLVFFLFTVAALPCLIFPGLGKWFSFLMASPLSVIEGISHYFSALSEGRVPIPPVWTVAAGILALWLLFGFFGKKTALAGLAGITGLLFFWCSGLFQDQKPELLILYGGVQKLPALTVSFPANDFSLAANLAGYSGAVAAADFLKQRGHSALTVLISSGTAGEYTRGAMYFPDMLKVRHYLAGKPFRRSGTAAKAVQKIQEHGTSVKMQPGKRLRWSSGARKVETFLENGLFSFDIWQNEHKVRIEIVPDERSGPTIRISGTGGALKLPRERQMGAIRIKLNW
ncbi:MAG: ComEC/Rec2 family competence protein [Lentisphaeria bacterium]|nr:ComEC/Rec2 family competence protein [Lentisphaeria bacterium]